MLSLILFITIGVWLKAPVWYFVICGVMGLYKLFEMGFDMYKAGAKKK